MKSPWLNLAADCLDRQPPRHTALIWEGRDGRQERYSFADLVGLTDRMANALEGLGFAPGDRLLLRLGNVPAFPVAFLGAVKAGVLPIPTGPGLSVQELAFRATDSEARGILVAQELRDLAEAVRERWTGLHSVLTTDADGSLTSLLSGSRPGRPARPTRPSSSTPPAPPGTRKGCCTRSAGLPPTTPSPGFGKPTARATWWRPPDP